jgi:hypothetical protein
VLKVGDGVSVTTSSGETRGTLLAVSPMSIAVALADTSNTKRTFPADTVTAVRRLDRLSNGMSIGGQVGAGLGVLALVLSKGGIFRPCSSDSGSSFYACASVMIAGIAGAGVGIGAAIDRSIEQVVFTSTNPTARVTFSPMWADHRRGISAAVRLK